MAYIYANPIIKKKTSLHLTVARSGFLVQKPAKFTQLPFVILVTSEPRKLAFAGDNFQLWLIMINPR